MIKKIRLIIENRYADIGKKIKSIAIGQAMMFMIICWLVGFIVMFEDGDYSVLFGLLIIVVGTLGSSLSSFILYGFGELIDKVVEISSNTCVNKYSLDNRKKIVPSDVDVRKENLLLDNSLFCSDDEFTKKIFKLLILVIIVVLFFWVINS